MEIYLCLLIDQWGSEAIVNIDIIVETVHISKWKQLETQLKDEKFVERSSAFQRNVCC